MGKTEHSDVLLLAGLAAAGFLWFALRLVWGSISVPPLTDILVYLLLAPLAEELFFRGVLQDFFRKRIKSHIFVISMANVITSLIFGIYHIPFWGTAHALLVVIPSLAFGLLYDRTERLTYPIILHMVYNLNTFIV